MLALGNTSESLSGHLPPGLEARIVAGYSPIGDEKDVRPLLEDLRAQSCQICLPVVTATASPLSFRAWTPDCEMATDQYGVSFPVGGPAVTPDFILVPLLAFTPRGDRLGYGGGYYDRTLASLRAQGDVFACGVAYAGQIVESLPTDDHDERLDGILTEDGFRRVQ